MKVIRKAYSLIPFYENIIVEALKCHDVEYDSFLGPRIWKCQKGDRFIIRVRKGEMIDIRDILSFNYCVLKDWHSGRHDIPWSWKY